MERPSKLRTSGLKGHLKVINWIGVVAGVLMLTLPFMGPWWRAEVGTDAMNLAFSPFHYSADFLGLPITSTLVGYFILAAQLTVVIGGALLLTGSLMTDRWWGKKLMRFGAMKVFWMMIMFLVVMLLGAFAMNEFLPNMMSDMAEGGSVQVNVPYIAGSTTSTIQMEGATITAPITASLTGVFWVAVLTASLGLGARIYHGRLMKKLGVSTEPKPKPKEKPKSKAEEKPKAKSETKVEAKTKK
jgi:hypothetical protein